MWNDKGVARMGRGRGNAIGKRMGNAMGKMMGEGGNRMGEGRKVHGWAVPTQQQLGTWNRNKIIRGLL